MRKFNLKGKVAQKLKGLDAALSGNDAANPADIAAKAQAEEAGQKHGEIRYAWRTDVGRVRKNNQDAVIIGNGLFGVADGMGGHNGGEIASSALRDGLLQETEGREPAAELMTEAVVKVNHQIWEQQEKDATLSGMGTTLTLLWPAEKEMIIGQVGDSRAYLFRDGQMKQVTCDHSMVADMVRRGVLTEEQAACHPMRNYITRAVGTDDSIEVDVTTVQRQNGDRWIVCSDGLYGQMSKAELEETAQAADLEEASDRLLQLALEHGGRDNISFVLLLDEFTSAEPDNQKDPETEEEQKEENGDDLPKESISAAPDDSGQEGDAAQ